MSLSFGDMFKTLTAVRNAERLQEINAEFNLACVEDDEEAQANCRSKAIDLMLGINSCDMKPNITEVKCWIKADTNAQLKEYNAHLKEYRS